MFKLAVIFTAALGQERREMKGKPAAEVRMELDAMLRNQIEELQRKEK